MEQQHPIGQTPASHFSIHKYSPARETHKAQKAQTPAFSLSELIQRSELDRKQEQAALSSGIYALQLQKR